MGQLVRKKPLGALGCVLLVAMQALAFFADGVAPYGYAEADKFLRRALWLVPLYDERLVSVSRVFSDILRADKERDLAATFSRASDDVRKALEIGCLFLNDPVCAEGRADTAVKYYKEARDKGLEPGAFLAAQKFPLRIY